MHLLSKKQKRCADNGVMYVVLVGIYSVDVRVCCQYLFHTYLIKNKATIMSLYPYQASNPYLQFHKEAMFYYNYEIWVLENSFNFGITKYQNVFIKHLYYYNKVQKIENYEKASPNDKDTNKNTT